MQKKQKIYVDPAEGKMPVKGEPTIEHKTISSQELAKGKTFNWRKFYKIS